MLSLKVIADAVVDFFTYRKSRTTSDWPASCNIHNYEAMELLAYYSNLGGDRNLNILYLRDQSCIFF